jgi:hypothetical protein
MEICQNETLFSNMQLFCTPLLTVRVVFVSRYSNLSRRDLGAEFINAVRLPLANSWTC